MVSRGTFLLIISQIIFILSAFVINFGLARVLGPLDFGTFGIVTSVLIVVELFVITGIPEVMQKYGGEKPACMYLLKKRTLPWQLIYVFAVFGLFILCAPLVARVFGNDRYTFFIRLASFDIIFYGLFRYYLGIQIGLHRFEKNAVLNMVYSFSKLAAIFGLVFSGLSLTGALIGNTLGSVAGLAVALYITRLPKVDAELEEIPYLHYIVPNILYFVGLYLLFSIDLWFVEYHVGGESVGYYVSASTLSKVPYFLSIAMSASLLPSLSLAIKDRNRDRIKGLVHQFQRYFLLYVIIHNVVAVSMAEPVIVLLFGQAYRSAAPILSVLSPGLSFVALFALLNTILMACGRMKTIFYMTVLVIVLDVILNRILVPLHGTMGAACATTITAVVCVVLSGYRVYRELKLFLPILSLIRICGAGLTVFTVSLLIPVSGAGVMIHALGLGMLFMVLLLVLREINSKDLTYIRYVFVKE